MVVDNILSNIPTPVMTFAGSTFAGFFCGAVLRKILKILVIIVGTAFGLFFLGIQYMANKGYLGNGQMEINWDRIGNDTAIAFQNLYTQFSSRHIFAALGDGIRGWNYYRPCKRNFIVREDELARMIPRFSGKALYGNRVYMMDMTRKDKMKKGFVARTFHIPEDLDERLRIKAIKNKVRFSEITILALEEYLK